MCRVHVYAIKWYHLVSDDEAQCGTNQPSLTEISWVQHLTSFGHIA